MFNWLFTRTLKGHVYERKLNWPLVILIIAVIFFFINGQKSNGAVRSHTATCHGEITP